MALTIKYNPEDRYMSAHESLVFVLLEDTKPFNSTTYPDYKYICDVYIVIDGVETLAIRLKSFPRPGDKYGVFDIGNIVRSYFYTEFKISQNNIFLTQILNENEFFINVICRFGEEYNFVTYPNLLIDSQRSYFNHYNGRQFGTKTILTDYIDKATTTRPTTTTVDRNAKYCLVPFLASDDSNFLVDVKCYNNSVGLVRQASFLITPTSGAIDELHLYNVSPFTINANVSAGTLIDDYIDYYTVTFNTTNITDDTTLRFNITCESKYEVIPIHFLNKFGGLETKEFSKVSRKTFNVEKSDYGRQPYTINSSGAAEWFDSTSKIYNDQVSTYAVEFYQKMQINTDILSDSEYQWLAQLVFSPRVFCEISGYFFQVSVTDNNYEPKKIINDKLTNLTLNIEFGERFNTQYR